MLLVLLLAQGPGLVMDARDGDGRRVVLVTPTPHFSLGAGESIHPRLSPSFRAAWTGLLRVVRGGRYTLTGEARILLDGREAGDAPVDLAAGDHPLRIEVRRREGPARLRLTWASDAFSAEPVPAAALFHRETPPGLEAERIVERGRELAIELGCARCHEAPLPARGAPDLTRVGTRTNVRWLAKWLANPRAFRAGAVMPVLLAPEETGHVAAYLASLTDPEDRARAAPSDAFRRARGRELFAKRGCGQCHGDKGVSLEGLGSKTDAAHLAQFLKDPPAVDPGGRMPSLLLDGEEAALLAEHLVESRNPAFEAAPPAGDAARGAELVRSRGCLACHAIEGERNARKAPAWSALDASRGCLAETPPTTVPRFDLSDGRRAALRAFAVSFRKAPDRSPAPAHAFRRIVRSLRCTACHELEASVPEGLEAMPPALTDAGNKLRRSWIESVLLKKKRVRPWMELRMPHFGREAVAPLVEGFAAMAGAPRGEREKTPDPTEDQIEGGIRLIGRGEGGLSCITCHDFKGRVSLGTRGPDMTEMAARMRPAWFRRWMRDPIRIQAGTAMPNFFASVDPAEAGRKMDLLWACLSAGDGMPMPEGFATPESFLLVVGETPLTVRTFMPDASPRAIAVGLPGRRSFCFDAERGRVVYAWEGDFLDMAPAWAGRGGRPVRILGRRFWTAPDAFPLRLGDPDREPRSAYRGYELKEGVPEFLLTVDGKDVRQRVTGRPDGRGLRIRFTVAPQDKDVWIVLPPARGVTLSSPNGPFRDGRLRVAADGRKVEATVLLTPE